MIKFQIVAENSVRKYLKIDFRAGGVGFCLLHNLCWGRVKTFAYCLISVVGMVVESEAVDMFATYLFLKVVRILILVSNRDDSKKRDDSISRRFKSGNTLNQKAGSSEPENQTKVK